MEIQAIHHVAILTDNYERSKYFYTEILGFSILKETFRADRNSFKLDLSINGLYQIELFSFPDTKQRASFPEQKGLRHLAFGVADIDKARAELISKSIENICLWRYFQSCFLFFFISQEIAIYYLKV